MPSTAADIPARVVAQSNPIALDAQVIGRRVAVDTGRKHRKKDSQSTRNRMWTEYNRYRKVRAPLSELTPRSLIGVGDHKSASLEEAVSDFGQGSLPVQPRAALPRRQTLALGAAALSMPLTGKAASAQGFVQLPGTARDIAVGADSTVFIVGAADVGSGAGGIFRWDVPSFSWLPFPGAAQRISVDSAGNPWVIGADYSIYGFVNSQWVNFPGYAQDIAVGPNSTSGNPVVWVVAYANGGDGQVYELFDFQWYAQPGAGRRLTVNYYDGLPWVVNAKSQLFAYSYLNDVVIALVPGSALDIGSAAYLSFPGSQTTHPAWITSAIAPNSIQYYDTFNASPPPWATFGGQAQQIAVDPTDRPWVVNSAGAIFTVA